MQRSFMGVLLSPSSPGGTGRVLRVAPNPALPHPQLWVLLGALVLSTGLQFSAQGVLPDQDHPCYLGAPCRGTFCSRAMAPWQERLLQTLGLNPAWVNPFLATLLEKPP